MNRFLVVMSAAVVAVGLMVGGCVVTDDDENVGGGDGGYTYTGRTVKLGSFTWMAENLNRVTSNSWCYDNDPSNCDKYGRLYTWNAASRACPSGWRLPGPGDWNDLIDAAGGSLSGVELRAGPPYWDGTDDFGFSAVGGGERGIDGVFSNIDDNGWWWTSNERLWAGDVRRYAITMRISGGGSRGVNVSGYHEQEIGLSVRCVR